jgi:peroxiredoxin
MSNTKHTDQRYVIVSDDGKATLIAVEDAPGSLTVTDAKAVLATL